MRDQHDLPICITVHFKNFPESSLIRYKENESFRFYYLNSIKEACTVRLGSSKELLSLSTKNTNRLLEIAMNPSKMFKEYWELQKIIYDSYEYKRFPIKFCFSKTDIILSKPYDIDEHGLECDLSSFIIKSFAAEVSDELFKGIANGSYKLLVCSTELDLNTPMCFIAINFAYLDNYTYIVVKD